MSARLNEAMSTQRTHLVGRRERDDLLELFRARALDPAPYHQGIAFQHHRGVIRGARAPQHAAHQAEAGGRLQLRGAAWRLWLGACDGWPARRAPTIGLAMRPSRPPPPALLPPWGTQK